jgi:DNA-binding response OmpR family regulator
MTTLLVVEDNISLAECLCIELETQGFIVETTPEGSQALKRLRQKEPIDLVLLDWDLPDFSGLDLLQLMRKNNYIQPVMMLTAHNAVDHKVLALQSGADDYLAKPFSFDELEARIWALLRRSSGLFNAEKQEDPSKFTNGGQDDQRGGKSSLVNLLSIREFEVLRQLGEGKSNAEIADALFITHETVKSHVKSLLTKLKAKDRTHAVVIAFKEGIFEARDD